MIMPRPTGHAVAGRGCLLQVGVVVGNTVATGLTSSLVVGVDESLHQGIAQWSR